MQRILNVLSIAAFAMSLATWIVAAVRSSIRINCEILDWRYSTTDIIQAFFHVENNSSLPLSINSIMFVKDGISFPCELTQKSIHTTPQNRTWVSAELPAYLVTGQARNLLLEFLHAPDIQLAPGKTVDVLICTNRRKLHRSLSIPEQGRCFRTLLQKNK